METNNLRGAALVILGMLFFVINDAFVKSLTGVLEWHQTLTLRGAVACVTLIFLAIYMNGVQAPRQVAGVLRERSVRLRLLFEVLGASTWVLTLLNMPLSGVVAINQLAPVFMMLAGAVIFGEKLGVHRLGAAAISFAGVLCIVKPGSDSFTVFALLAVVATCFMAARDMVTRVMPQSLPVGYVAAFSAMALTLFGLCFSAFSDWPPMDWVMIRGGVGAGVAQSLAFLMVINGYRIGEVSFLAPFRYSALVGGVLIAYFAFGEQPDALAIAGAMAIILAGLYIIERERRLRRH